MKDIFESAIIITSTVFIIFFFGVFMTYIFMIKNNIQIPERVWVCKQAQMINNDPSKTECIVYARKVDAE